MENNALLKRSTTPHKKTSAVDMLSGSIFKGLLLMTWPIMLMNVVQSLVNVIDMTVLRIMIDDNAVGSVGACSTLISFITGFVIGIATGANVTVAKHVGAKEMDEAKSAIGTSILISLIGGIFLLIIGVVFARTFLVATNCPKSLLPDAITYFRLYFCGVPFILVYNFSASILRAMGDTRRPMIYLMLGGIIKIILNFSLILIFHAGIKAVGIATIISNLIAGGLTFFTLLKKNHFFCMKISEISFSVSEAKKVLHIGIPVGVQSGLWAIANVIIASTVNKFGAAATKGISIANQFDNLLYQICIAPSIATVSYISQNIGAGNISRVKKTIRCSFLITTIFGASFGFLSAFFSPQLSSIMSPDPIVIEYSCEKMRIISSTYFICGFYHVMCGALQGLNKPIVPTINTFMYMCVLRFVWVYIFFPLCPSLSFLYLVWPVGWVLAIVTMCFSYFPAISKFRKAQAAKSCTENNID